MRLRSFEARSMSEAMQEMRATLGEEAVIVATRELADRVRVTAAAGAAEVDLAGLLAPEPAAPVRGAIESCLAYHRVPPALAAALLAELVEVHAADPVAALTRILEARCRFLPLTLPAARPLALVGPPGAGKTAAVARLAAQARVAGQEVRVLSADLARAGGLAQLAALLAPLGIEPVPAGPEELGRLAAAGEAGAGLLLDSTGVNAFHGGEMAALAELLRAARAEPVLVLPAGLDIEDSLELAANFAALGARRLIVTRLDAARRLGGVLAAADLGLALAGASIGPAIGCGLPGLSATGLARVLLHRAGSACPPA
jgi:flagellar biosynthesis protein FlhF